MSAWSTTTRTLLTSVVIGAAQLSASAQAAEPPTIPRIGVLTILPLEVVLRESLRELGYVDGENILIEWRQATTNDEELRSHAIDLARSKVDVIVTNGTPAARAALAATTTIPVVFSAGDPVATGFAASLARPGRNGTGVSLMTTELIAKRLELLHQLVPHARRIAYLTNSSNPIALRQLEEAQKAARVLGLQLITLDARNARELDTALRTLPRSMADGVLVTPDLLLQTNKSKIAQAVRKGRLPAMVPYKQYLDDGTLMSYGPDNRDLARRMAGYVDRILKGTKPSDLPIEQVSKYELVIDLRAARELGIKVSQELLLRADEVIR